MTTDPPTPPQPPTRPPGIPDAIWAKMLEPGVTGTATYESILGVGKDWWADDAEFEQFLEFIRAVRRQPD